MPGTHKRAGSSGPISASFLSSRVIVALVLIVCYAALFYAVVRARAARSTTDGPPMFSAVVSELGERRAGTSSKPFTHMEDQTMDPPRHWTFRPIDIWPNPAGWSATVSKFTPVTDAKPDQPGEQQNDMPTDKPAARLPVLSMIRWLRPDYPMDWALAGKEGTVQLDLRIDSNGQPSTIMLTGNSGSPELDESTVRAAQVWRFAPPLWNGRPVEVWAHIEVRYHRSGDQE
jgi:TonB family protein